MEWVIILVLKTDPYNFLQYLNNFDWNQGCYNKLKTEIKTIKKYLQLITKATFSFWFSLAWCTKITKNKTNINNYENYMDIYIFKLLKMFNFNFNLPLIGIKKKTENIKIKTIIFQ